LDLLGKNQLAEKDELVAKQEDPEGMPQEKKLKKNFETGDKHKIEKATQQTLDLLVKYQLARRDEFEAKQKELEGVVTPNMMKVYQAARGASGSGCMSGCCPIVMEVD